MCLYRNYQKLQTTFVLKDLSIKSHEMEDMDTKNDTSSSDNSSSDGEDEQNKLEARAAALEMEVFADVYLYDRHVELVDLYRRLGDLTSMRAAYERFAKAYPLTPTIWREWIRDEIKIANTPKEKKKVLELFKKAIQDYHSVPLWQEYCQFAIGNCTVEEVRETFETGLNYIGLHVSEGSLLWDMYREFEMAHLSLADPESEQCNEQLKRVVEIYRRQLRVPLLDMENTFKEFQQFVEQLPEDHGIDMKQIEWAYGKAIKQLESYKGFEEDLLRCEDDGEAYKIYKKYIEVIGDPIMVVCTYERAVARLCLNVELWVDYCLYAIKLGEIAVTSSEKAIRNCPWVAELWSLRLKIFEINKKPEEEILKCFEDSLKSVSHENHLELWRSYIEYTRRQDNEEKVVKIFSQAREQLSLDIDQLTKLMKIEAHLKAKNDYLASRSIWNEIMQANQNKTSGNLWMEFISLEKQYGTPQNIRNSYQKAMKNCLDWAEYFADEWLIYEQSVGTVQDVLRCITNKKKILQSVEEQKSKIDIKRKFDEIQNNSNGQEIKQHKKQKHSKEVIEKPCIKIIQVPTDIDEETTVFISNITSEITTENLKNLFPKSTKVTIPTDKHGVSRCFAYVQFPSKDEAKEALGRDREPIDGRPMFVSKCIKDRTGRQSTFKYQSKREPKKLFVRGLPLSYDKDKIKEVFKEFDPVDVRLVTKFNGKSKGLAYVEFATEEVAQKAMEGTDNKELEGFTISVAISSPPAKPKPEKQTSSNVNTYRSIAHPKNKLQFLPRCIGTKKSEEQVSIAAKSNDDFRNMINQKN